MAGPSLATHLVARGAVEGRDQGRMRAAHFGDAAAEAAALREAAGVCSLDDRVLVAATGEDRAVFLQGMLTGDVAALVPGRGCPALLLTIQGRVVADLRVACVPEALLLDVDRRVERALVEALERLIVADDVELAVDEETALLALAGPAAPDVLPALATLAPFAHAVVPLGGVQVRLQRASPVGGEGAVVHAPAAAAPAAWDALVAAGAVPCGWQAVETRRIEQGVPRIGVDMGEGTLALEVPVDDAISATKGCYLGQEVIARGTARGHVNRRLCGLVFAGPLPVPPAPLVRDGKEVGTVTSAAPSQALGCGVGLGLVRREHWEPGTELAVRQGHAVTVARVAGWPLA